ncbi:hypothetical protein JCM8547_006918 [Rhodosporidiobolus lusitaniae]
MHTRAGAVPVELTGARSWFEAPPGTLKHGVKSHIVGMVAEFVGTTVFLFLALCCAQVASTAATSVARGIQRADAVDSVAAVANTTNLLYIAFAFGFSLVVNVFVFAPLSDGLLNPAVSLGLVIWGAMKPLRAVLLTVAQLLGDITASGLVYGLLPGGFDVRTTLSKETSLVQGFFIAALLTALMLSILLLAVEKNQAAPVAALGIGLALFCAELVGVNFTGGSLNPARSLGPAVIVGQFGSYFWIYIIAPCVGAAFAAGLYRFFKFLDYKTCLEAHSGSPDGVLDEEKADYVPPISPTPTERHFPSPSQRPSIVSTASSDKIPRDPRNRLGSMTSASTLE